MQLILLLFIFIAIIFFIVVGTILKVVFKVKNAFSPNNFTNSSQSADESEGSNYTSTNSQIVTSEAGRRRLNKLKASAEDAEIIYEQR